MELFEDSSSYLNQLRQRRLDKLWHINEEFHEVDIFKENNNVLEKSFDDILNMSGFQCHICNLEVPKMYIKEHNQSSTHQNLLKLTDEALERTKKQIRNTETSNLTIKVENTYFCNVCSRIVENSEKDFHEKSNFHRKCENFDNVLSCFVDSYLNINEKQYDLNCNLDFPSTMQCNLDSNDLTEIEPTKNKSEELHQMQNTQELKSPKNFNINEKKYDLNCNIDFPPYDNTVITKIELTENKSEELNQNTIEIKSPKKTKKEKIKSYIEIINSKYPNENYKVEFISKRQIKITALNKDVVIVPLQNFHSYNNKFCRVCLSELDEDHDMSEDHISRIMTPVEDKNGIREVDDIWNHCIVCNELTKTVASHNQTFEHLKNLKKYHLIQFSRKQMVQTENFQNQREDTQTADTQSQTKDQKSSVSKIDISPQFDEFFKMIETKIDSLFPIFKKAVENEIDSDHSEDFQLVDRKHKANIPNQNITVKENNNSEIKNNKIEVNEELLQQINNINPKVEPKPSHYCYVCRIDVADFNTHKLLASHKLMSKENKKRSEAVKKIMHRNYFLLNKNGNLTNYKCGLCEVIVNYEIIGAHVNTDVHRKNYLKFMEDNKIIVIDDQECHCEPCDQRQSRINVFDHCNSPLHAIKLKKHINKNNVENTVQENPKKNSNNKKKTAIQTVDISKLFGNFKDKGENLLCKSCYVHIPKIDVAIKKHVGSTEHCNKYNGIMRDNKIQVNTDSFYCEICLVKISVGSEIDHVYSNSHRETVVLKSKTKSDESNHKNTEPIPSTSKSVIDCVPKIQPKKIEAENIKDVMLPVYLKHHFNKTTKTHVFCIICRVSILNSEIIEHGANKTHRDKFDILMFQNGIKIKEGSVYSCLCCKTTITRFNEIDHIFGKIHTKNAEGKSLADFQDSGLKRLTFNYILSIPGGDRLVKLNFKV